MSGLSQRWGAGWPQVGVLYVLAVIAYVLLGRHQPLPLIAPDEYRYGHFARSLIDGQGFHWRGAPEPIRSPLYIYLIAPAWLLNSTVHAYEVAKGISALVVCMVVFPTWLIARVWLGPRLALLPALLSVAGTLMLTAGGLMTENAALPLSAACLSCTVMAVARPGSRWGWWAIGFALLAAFARAQMLVLVGIVFAALLLDVARAWPEPEARALLHRPILLAGGGIFAAVVLLGLFAPDLIAGVYAGASGFRPSVPTVATMTGKHAIGLITMAGFVPFAFVLSALFTPAAWRDEATGPLLTVLVPATVVLTVVAGWFVAGLRFTWGIERYVEYVVPLTFVLMVALIARPGLLNPFALAGALLVGAVLLAAPRVQIGVEERALYAMQRRMHDLFGLSSPAGLALFGVLAGLAAVGLVLYVRPRWGGPQAAWAAGALTLVVLLFQSQAAWVFDYHLTRGLRAAYPADLQWIDHAAKGRAVGRLVSFMNRAQFDNEDLFNRSITRVYRSDSEVYGRPFSGGTCTWKFDADGTASFQNTCGVVPPLLLEDDLAAQPYFIGQKLLARGVGTLLDVPAPVRARSFLILPCDRRQLTTDQFGAIAYRPPFCRGAFSGVVWAAAPATLTLTVLGTSRDVPVRFGGRLQTIRASGLTRVSMRLKRGRNDLTVPFQATQIDGRPLVVRATLGSGAGAVELLH